MGEKRISLSRRTLLKGSAAAAGLAAASAVGLGMPHVARAQANTIRIGVPTILSGRVAILGTSSVAALELAIAMANEKGGVGGKMLELVVRDSKGKPDEAAKTTRDLVNTDGCEIIVDAEASSGSFAVHEVIRELGVLCLHTCSETSELTANPALHLKSAFRCARQGIHDAIGGGHYASGIAKEKGLKRWMSCSPDYAYGRGNTEEFLLYLKHFQPDVEVVDESWPKLFQPDYTENITKILQVQPQAMYSALWGGDLVAFIEQANLYGLFNNLTMFNGGLADPPVLAAIKNVPVGIHSVYRYNRLYPANPENVAFNDLYQEKTGQGPTNWSWQNFVAGHFIIAGLELTGGATDGAKLGDAIAGRTIESPLGVVDRKITMRASDHTIIGYPVAWAPSISKDPYFENWTAANWEEIEFLERDWKKSKGWA